MVTPHTESAGQGITPARFGSTASDGRFFRPDTLATEMAASKVETPPGPLQAERLPSGERKLLRNLKVKLNDGTAITVPRGFVTDFSSIPWLARPFLRWSKVDIAGVVHDFLYWCPQKGIDRKRADAIWREIAGSGQHCAIWIQRWGGYVGLVLFGGKAWRKAKIARGQGRGRICVPSPAPGPISLKQSLEKIERLRLEMMEIHDDLVVAHTESSTGPLDSGPLKDTDFFTRRLS